MTRKAQELLKAYKAKELEDLDNTKRVCELAGVAFPEAVSAPQVQIHGRQMLEALQVLKGVDEASMMVDAEIYAAASLVVNS